jgi:hypothetical protein
MWRNALVYFGAIVVVVAGAWWYLNVDRCGAACQAERAAQREARCAQELDRFRLPGSDDYRIGYLDRIRLVLKGCL